MRIRLALLLLFGLSQSLAGFAAAVPAGAAQAAVAHEHCAAEADASIPAAGLSADGAMTDCADGCQLCVACAVGLTAQSLRLAAYPRAAADGVQTSSRLMRLHELLFRPPIYS